MTKNILLVTGSARKGRAADKVLARVQQELATYPGVMTTVADLKQLDLPFFDSEHIPLSPEYTPTDERVARWSGLVQDADAIVLLMPEYNHSMSAIQKNALDWLSTELQNKPISVVGYGWSGGSRALDTATAVLGNLKGQLLPSSSQLRFMKEIHTDGAVADEDAVSAQLQKTTAELIGASQA